MTVPVSVVVCTRNRVESLARCLQGLLSSPEPAAEVLVVDQSEDDRTRDLVLSMQPDEAGRLLRYVRNDGRGMAASQNAGFRLAAHDVVLVTDDDAVPAPDWARQGWSAFRDDPGLHLLGGRVLPLGPDVPGSYPVSTRTSRRPRELDGVTAPWDVGSGNCFGVLRATAVSVGNDERLGPGAPFLGGADMDLFRRVLRDGRRGRYEPAFLVLHERVDRAGRLGRRIPYGYGTGAALVLWWRQGDSAAPLLLASWLRLRMARLREGVRTRDGLRVHEELLVLIGTARGLVRAGLARRSAPLRTDGL